MVEKYIELLEKQIEKLDAKDFDLKSWRIYTNAIISRIFGENSRIIRQLDELKYDFGSWSLRDAGGAKTSKDSVRSMAREILESAISELHNFGLPETAKQQAEAEESLGFIYEAFRDELKGSQYKSIQTILESSKSDSEKKQELKELLKQLDNESLLNILADIISNPSIGSHF